MNELRLHLTDMIKHRNDARNHPLNKTFRRMIRTLIQHIRSNTRWAISSK